MSENLAKDMIIGIGDWLSKEVPNAKRWHVVTCFLSGVLITVWLL